MDPARPEASVSCQDVSFDDCTRIGQSKEDVAVRQLCAKRCGCNKVDSGTVRSVFDPNSGCPRWTARLQSFVKQLDDLTCNDSRTLDSWQAGLGPAELTAYNMTRGLKLGCPEIVKKGTDTGKIAERVCETTSLPALCPTSCGCGGPLWANSHIAANGDYCPRSCPMDGRKERLCFTVKGEHNNTYSSHQGPLIGYACQFPFAYQGKEYSECTTDGWPVPWCSIAYREGYSYHWGDCDETCDIGP